MPDAEFYRGVEGVRGAGGSPVHQPPLVPSASAPVDLRKRFRGLEGLVSERLGEDLRQGARGVFTNRRPRRWKILYWEGTGLWLLLQRLAQGTFSWPKGIAPQNVKLKLAPEALGHADRWDRPQRGKEAPVAGP